VPSGAVNVGALDTLAGEIVDDVLDFPSRFISIGITASDGVPLAVRAQGRPERGCTGVLHDHLPALPPQVVVYDGFVWPGRVDKAARIGQPDNITRHAPARREHH